MRIPLKHLPQHSRRLDIVEETFVTSLVNYARNHENNYEELKRICLAVWPACDFYRGGTHIRVLIEGESNGKSFYVETI